ncbi:TniB family NTP-binding protein [Orrella marina]|uniref:AAA+ ATPase domain-containing protein n=1 Tax=Orrella marina TaxID=2163011 RepID=A0A2R4XLS0_9BURK|nr:TniB family NTP-binding protein [Orrella marina]AWB34711.1 hypothetical protein DBV39_14395 [Orrella marina]
MTFAERLANCVSEEATQRDLYGYRLKTSPIIHQRFKKGIYTIGELHHARRLHGRAAGILVTGPSGVGKTMLVGAYAEKHQREANLQHTKIPVLMVTVPSSPTSKSLAAAILLALGYPKAHNGSAPQKTALICDLITRCDVEVLVLDEFQHLFYAPTNALYRDVTDWLKNLINLVKVVVVACGLHESSLVVSSNEQLQRRFSTHFQMSRFDLEDAEDFKEFRSVLRMLQSILPIESETPFHDANLARRIHLASYGLLDYVRKLIEGATSVCARAGLDRITQEVFAAAFRENIWREVPDRKNPFHPDSYLQPLDKGGEPFYLHNAGQGRTKETSTRTRLHVPKGR